MLVAFRLDVTKQRYENWDDVIDYCRYSAMPVGRFMLDVHGEDTSTWAASDALCAALQINNHLQDCGKDYRNLNRVYLPRDALAAAGATVEMLGEAKSQPALLNCLQALAVRTEGIYTIMITLAIGAAFYYFTNQNWAIFNGHTGINTVATPHFWGVDWRSDIAFYYVTLGVAAISYFAVQYVSRAPFGLALQGVRDNPRRMGALGFNPNAHRIAAYAFAAFIAALGGVLQVWNYRQISPGSVSVGACIDVLIIAVVGGITRPIGPFIGALIFVLLRTFALDVLIKFGLDGNRFRLLIGLGFLAIVFWSSDGVIGLWERWRRRNASSTRGSGGGRHG